jgi:hypothetical protein
MSQKMAFFIVAAVKTSSLTQLHFCPDLGTLRLILYKVKHQYYHISHKMLSIFCPNLIRSNAREIPNVIYIGKCRVP